MMAMQNLKNQFNLVPVSKQMPRHKSGAVFGTDVHFQSSEFLSANWSHCVYIVQ